jgi:hypothetical protein
MRYLVHALASEAVTNGEAEDETGTRMERLLRRDIPNVVVRIGTPAVEHIIVIAFRDVHGDIDDVHVVELTHGHRERFEAPRARRRAAKPSDSDAVIDQDAWYGLLRPEITTAAWFAYVRPERPDARITRGADQVDSEPAWEHIRDAACELRVLVYARRVTS